MVVDIEDSGSEDGADKDTAGSAQKRVSYGPRSCTIDLTHRAQQPTGSVAATKDRGGATDSGDVAPATTSRSSKNTGAKNVSGALYTARVHGLTRTRVREGGHRAQ